jgi:tRNA 2-thiouridine synthesizing protein A
LRWIKLSDLKVDVTGETCPVPLVEMRKALKKAAPGEIVEVLGTHPASKKEIPMAVEALGYELVDVEEIHGVWHIKIRKK